jgi:hypothetical protein
VGETGEVGVEKLATAEGPQMLEDRRGSVIAAPGLGGVGGLDDIKSQIGEIWGQLEVVLGTLVEDMPYV